MKLVHFLFAAFVVFFAIACSNDSSTQSNQSVDPNAQTAPVAPAEGQVAPAPAPDPAQSQSPAVQVQPQQAAPSGIQAPAGGNTGVPPATNPPHGQPFHRCDIAVGAPLPK